MSDHFEKHQTEPASKRWLSDAEKIEIREIVRAKWQEKAPGAVVRVYVGKETDQEGKVRVRITVHNTPPT
jgi:hypothetical protein